MSHLIKHILVRGAILLLLVNIVCLPACGKENTIIATTTVITTTSALITTTVAPTVTTSIIQTMTTTVTQPVTTTETVTIYVTVTPSSLPEINDTPVSEQDNFEGSQWKVILLNGSPLIEGTYISLYFREESVGGFSGVNRYGGSRYIFNSDDMTVVFPNIVRTLIGGPFIEQEKAYLKALEDAITYRVDGNHLVFFNQAQEQVLLLERIPEYEIQWDDLIGTDWHLESMNGEIIPEGLEIKYRVDSISQALGQAGCFRYSLQYHPNGDDMRSVTLSFTRTGTLAQGLENWALRYLECLGWAANCRFVPDRLEILTARGDVLAYKPYSG